MTMLRGIARPWGGLCVLGLALIISGCGDAPPPKPPTPAPTTNGAKPADATGDMKPKGDGEMPADGDQADPEAGSQTKSKAGGGKK